MAADALRLLIDTTTVSVHVYPFELVIVAVYAVVLLGEAVLMSVLAPFDQAYV